MGNLRKGFADVFKVELPQPSRQGPLSDSGVKHCSRGTLCVEGHTGLKIGAMVFGGRYDEAPTTRKSTSSVVIHSHISLNDLVAA